MHSPQAAVTLSPPTPRSLHIPSPLPLYAALSCRFPQAGRPVADTSSGKALLALLGCESLLAVRRALLAALPLDGSTLPALLERRHADKAEEAEAVYLRCASAVGLPGSNKPGVLEARSVPASP
jgi:hypothetical protein